VSLGPLIATPYFFNRLERPGADTGAALFTCFIPSIDLEPADLPLTVGVAFAWRRRSPLGGRPNIDTSAVAANKWNDRVVRDNRFTVVEGNAGTSIGGDLLVHPQTLLMVTQRSQLISIAQTLY